MDVCTVNSHWENAAWRVSLSLPKAGAGAGMCSHVLQRANYARFHSNQTLCQVISIIIASSLGEVIQ